MAEPDLPVEPADETTAFLAEEAGQEIASESPVAPESSRRPGCLLVGIAGAVGALIGALTAGLLLVIVLAGDDGGPSGGDDVADAGTAAPSEGHELVEALADAPAEVTPPEGSTGDSDFWSSVLADSDLFSGIASGASGAQSEDDTLDLSPDLLADVWARMLTGESDEPGAPLGSRIEGINVKAVLEAVQESVVIVKSPNADNPGRGGSGFVVAADGHIVTNEHVVRDPETVEVRLFGGELVPAEVVASDPARDLAVLKIDRDGLSVVRLGSTEGVEVGDEVIAIGNALGIIGEPTVTAGIVSGLNRGITLPDNTRLVRLIQTDAAINPGNSGGPLVSAAGEVIGVNTAVAGGLAEGIGYAISIDYARPIIDQLLDGLVHAKAFLGVGIVSVEDVLAERGDDGPETLEPGQDPGNEFAEIDIPPQVTFGAYVVRVESGHSAERAGIVPGDVIVSLNGLPIRTSAELINEVLARVPGDEIELGVIGLDGRLRSVELALGAAEATD